MKNYLMSVFFGVKNTQDFLRGLQQCVNNINPAGIFSGDNLFTFGRNLGFLDDDKFFNSFSQHTETPVEKAIIWRIHTLAWAAHSAMKLDGDFMECACYKGTSARIICDYVDIINSNKKYYLYDLFEHDPSMIHHAMPEHGANLYDKVKARFKDFPNVIVTKGYVPQILYEVCPEKISFLHLDLNNAPAEIGALEFVWDRMVKGAILVLDDYGWLGYRAQKIAEDEFFLKRGYKILELPTGQGLLIK